MSHQLAASDYSPNFHRNGPPPPPLSTYDPRRTDHFSYGGKNEGLNHTTNNHHNHHHHLPLNQTTPINTSPTTSSFYNNTRSSMQLHQYHHLRSNNVAALPSSSSSEAFIFSPTRSFRSLHLIPSATTDHHHQSASLFSTWRTRRSLHNSTILMRSSNSLAETMDPVQKRLMFEDE